MLMFSCEIVRMTVCKRSTERGVKCRFTFVKNVGLVLNTRCAQDGGAVINVAYNMDCMLGMKEYPDQYFDLAVVDPPYGAGFTEKGGNKGWFTKYHQEQKPETVSTKPLRFHGGDRWNKYIDQQMPDDNGNKKKTIVWDVAPGPEYFEELFRISKNQIIWGGNYFPLPPTRCFLIWRKLTISENFTMAMAEYAWTSFDENAKVFDYAPQDSKRFHPTQKPKALYDWIFGKYAKPGMKVLDTHLGSGSSRLAAYDAGLDFVGYEIDKVYFDKQEERFNAHISQQSLFTSGEQIEQMKI